MEYGFTGRTAELFRANAAPDARATPGRVVRLDRNRVLVASRDGLLHLPYPAHGLVPATGDWVWLGHNNAGEPAVVDVLPRHSALSRKRAFEASSEEQILGSNIDIVAVVVPVDRPLTHNRLERTLVAAWDSGATPLVVITKADLAHLADDVVGEVILQAAGVEVVTTSAEQGDGLDELMRHIPGAQRWSCWVRPALANQPSSTHSPDGRSSRPAPSERATAKENTPQPHANWCPWPGALC